MYLRYFGVASIRFESVKVREKFNISKRKCVYFSRGVGRTRRRRSSASSLDVYTSRLQSVCVFVCESARSKRRTPIRISWRPVDVYKCRNWNRGIEWKRKKRDSDSVCLARVVGRAREQTTNERMRTGMFVSVLVLASRSLCFVYSACNECRPDIYCKYGWLIKRRCQFRNF